MHASQSHGRPGFFNFLLTQGWVIALPVVLSLIVGGRIIHQASRPSRTLQAEQRSQALAQEERLLVDRFWSALDLVRWKTVVQSQNPGTPQPGILAWAQLNESKDGDEVVRSAAVSPLEDLEWKKALQSFKPGVLGVIVKSGSDRLAVAFPMGNHTVLAALIDPQELLAPSAQRAFLLGQDGRVLAHTTRSYLGSDFSGLPYFKALFKSSEIQSGTLESTGIDQLPVTLAYSHLGSFPFLLGVEQVSPRGVSLDIPWRRVLFFALLLAATLLACVGWFWRQRSDLFSVPAELAMSLPPEEKLIRPQDLFRLQEIQTDSNRSESAFLKEVQTDPILLKRDRELQVLLSKFEQEGTQITGSFELAEKLVHLVSLSTGARSLYFVYRRNLNAAVLQAGAGFSEQDGVRGMSFPVSAELIVEAGRAEMGTPMENSRALTPLLTILASRLGLDEFEVWPLLSYVKGELLGFLVIVGGARGEQKNSVSRVVCASSLIYENSQLTP